jgi:type I restriction enzyme M protein
MKPSLPTGGMALRPDSRHSSPASSPRNSSSTSAESLLAHYMGKPLINHYDVYQHLMDYWAETMQDDCYLIAADGWKAETYRIIETDKKGKKRRTRAGYFLRPRPANEPTKRVEEEHAPKFSELEKISKGNVKARLKEIKGDTEAKEEAAALTEWVELNNGEAAKKKAIKAADAELEKKTLAKYPSLTEQEIKVLVIGGKWLRNLAASVRGEMIRVSQNLTHRVSELAQRYEGPLPALSRTVAELEQRVASHLKTMGFAL